MTYKHATLRPAMTAIAAVIALSSTPLLAQAADPAVATTPAVEAPAPAAADPVAPAPVVETPTAADPVAPKTTATTAHKATTAKTTHATKTVTKTVTKSTHPAAAAPATAALPPASPAPVAEPLPMQPEVAATPVVAPADQPPATAQASNPDMLPIAGAAGIGILVLAGAGLALRRRRRRADELDEADVVYADEQPQAAEPMMADVQPAIVEPAFISAPAAAAMAEPQPAAGQGTETEADLTPVEGPTTEVPESFDLSRFGPNVRAAYCGPTVDNPSLSLKHRLRKATAMDQMERNAAETEADTVPAEAAAEPTTADQSGEDFMLARARKPAARPTYIN